MIIKKLQPFIVIQATVVILLLISIGFWAQPFVKTSNILGISGYSITGFEIAFGTVKEVPIPGPTQAEQIITLNKSIFVEIGFIFSIVTTITEIVILILSIIKKINQKQAKIISLASAAPLIVTIISIFLAQILFSKANKYYSEIYKVTGSITTAILLIGIVIIILINSIEIFIRKSKINLIYFPLRYFLT